jgi:hypothetical protein
VGIVEIVSEMSTELDDFIEAVELLDTKQVTVSADKLAFLIHEFKNLKTEDIIGHTDMLMQVIDITERFFQYRIIFKAQWEIGLAGISDSKH